MMNHELKIWMDDKEYFCNVNEHTTCDEVIQLVIKPPAFVNEMSHSFELNACEYKVDKLLFAKESGSSNNSRNGSMNVKEHNDIFHIPRKSEIAKVYDSRIQELSERISLLDSSIELYDNTDVEDGLSDDEIIENQITRMGILLKKQSIAIKYLLKQQNECLYTGRIEKERLLAELDKDYSQMKVLDHKLQRFQSTLDVLNWRLIKRKINPKELSNLRNKNHDTCSSELTKNKVPTDWERSYIQDHEAVWSCGTGQTTLKRDLYNSQDNDDSIKDIKNNERMPGSDADRIENGRKEILTRKEILSLKLNLKDEETSVLV